ncbi:hypothetical protein MSG28_013747 [Choristoneura fumiferana]|uniref:Uncharacterized protein n=1 Tax=Choristoneura fumiferana TaxID=7141 RepID=A0ACC0K995_CHOFU|nr:hypothetical protein MSG28_013747 [Choristoneura fumiferana]
MEHLKKILQRLVVFNICQTVASTDSPLLAIARRISPRWRAGDSRHGSPFCAIVRLLAAEASYWPSPWLAIARHCSPQWRAGDPRRGSSLHATAQRGGSPLLAAVAGWQPSPWLAIVRHLSPQWRAGDPRRGSPLLATNQNEVLTQLDYRQKPKWLRVYGANPSLVMDQPSMPSRTFMFPLHQVERRETRPTQGEPAVTITPLPATYQCQAAVAPEPHALTAHPASAATTSGPANVAGDFFVSETSQ